MYGVSRLRASALVLLALAFPAVAEPLDVPSGQPVTLTEVLTDENPGALWVRFRFLAPEIARGNGKVTPEDAAADMDWLCAHLALDYLARYEMAPARVVISLSDRAVPFGVADPSATQFFESYRPVDGRCIWEGF